MAILSWGLFCGHSNSWATQPGHSKEIATIADSDNENSDDDDKNEVEDDAVPEMEEWKPEPEPESPGKSFGGQHQLSYEAQVKHKTILTEPVPSSRPDFVFPEKNLWKPEIEFRPEAYPGKFQEEWTPRRDEAVVEEEEDEDDDDDDGDLPEMEELKPGEASFVCLRLISKVHWKRLGTPAIQVNKSIYLETTNPKRIYLVLNLRSSDVISSTHCLTRLKILVELWCH